jgi:hypothetical protein
MAVTLSVSISQLTILSIRAGSVVVDVRITADPTLSTNQQATFNATAVAQV